MLNRLLVFFLFGCWTFPSFADDRTTYDDGSRPQILINWKSFEDNGFPAEWKWPFTNVVINGYTRINRVAGIDVRPQFFGFVEDRTDSNPGEIVISANAAHATSTRLASTFGSFPDRLKIVFHRNSGATMTPWNFTPYYPEPGEYSMQAIFMHELGHALGLDHNASGKSIMNGGYSFWDHFGPHEADVDELRALYPLRTSNRLRLLESEDGGATWRRVANDVTSLGSSAASTTHSPTVAGDNDSAHYLLAWTSPGKRLNWLRTNGRYARDWLVYGGGPEVTFGSAMAAGGSDRYLWAIVTIDGDDRKLNMLRSNDGGTSWQYVGFPDVETYGRPGLAYTRVDGDPAWIAVWGNHDDQRDQTGLLYSSVSRDGGSTWSTPEPLSTFYRVHDGVSIDCNEDNHCLLGFVWGGQLGGFAYGQNRLRFMEVQVDPSGGTLVLDRTCYPTASSRVAPGIAFDESENRFVIGVREQDFNTSQGMLASGSGCPGPFSHIATSSSHVAPDAGSNRFFRCFGRHMSNRL